MADDFSGMKVEVVRGKIAPGLHQQSQACTNVVNEVNKLMTMCQDAWKGSDAKQFAQKWNEYQPKLKQLAQELEQLSQTAKKNADAQQSTSSAL